MYNILFPIKQLKSLKWSFLYISVNSILVVGGVYIFHVYRSVPLDLLTNDATVAANVPIYFGIQSQIGIFFWAAAAAIFLFTSTLLNNNFQKNFLIASGCFVLMLGLDDIFLFHEVVFPSLGFLQKYVFLTYAILMLAYGLKYLKTLLQTDYVLFAMALGFFGISLIIDNFFYDQSQLVTQLLEDGTKFIGILFWFVYSIRTCRKMVNKSISLSHH